MWFAFILTCHFIHSLHSYPIVISPARFRVNFTEKIVIFPNKDEAVTVEIKDARPERDLLFKKVVNLNAGKVTEVGVALDKLPVTDKGILTITTGDESRNSLVSVGDAPGYGFIQTDKPVYTPKEKVRMRLLRLGEDLTLLKEPVRLQIKNPQGVTMDSINMNTTTNGSSAFFEHEFVFPPAPMMGFWYAVMSYGPMYRKSTNVSFEVLEYVLPTFSVKLVSPKFITPSTLIVMGWIDAKYVYGRPVKGAVTFRFGIRDVRTKERTWFGRTNPKQLKAGSSSYHFSTNEFRTFVWFPGIKNHRFVVEATVVEDETGKRETVLDEGCVFVEKPYTISFLNTYNGFKPDENIVFSAQVLDPHNQPVKNLPVIISVESKNFTRNITTDTNGEALVNFRSAWGDRKLEVSVATLDPSVPDADQTLVHHTLLLQESSLAYIIIENKTEKVLNIGDTYQTKVYIQGATYLFDKLLVFVLVRGHIYSVKEIEDNKTFSLNIERWMAPIFRIAVLAYNNNYFIAESISVRVSDKNCGLKIAYSNPKDGGTIVLPGDKGRIVLQGTSGDSVALLGIDEAVYAFRKKATFTKQGVLDEMMSHDSGCGRGGGLNPLDVVLNAGMLVVGYGSNELGSKCTEKLHKRRVKRDTSSIVRRFEGRLKDCCILGMADDKFRRDCNSRLSIVKRHLSNDQKCQEAFLQCCTEAYNPKGSPVTSSHWQSPKPEDDRQRTDFVHVAYEQEYEEKAFVRQDFRETWLFDVMPLQGDTASLDVSVPHSITTWSVEAMSLSSARGLCMIDEPLRIVSFKPIFIQVDLPYSVVKNEQVEMSVTVYNYASQRESVVVYMYGLPDVCSEAEPYEKSQRRRVSLDPNSLERVAFPLVPLKVGKYEIKVVAIGIKESDVVIKTLNVIPQGIPVENDYTFSLDPKNVQARKRRSIVDEKFREEIDEKAGIQKSQLIIAPTHNQPLIVPNSQECIISAIADGYGPTVKTAMVDVGHLIRKPQGCGEQTVMFMGPTLFTLKYLDSTNRLTGDKRYRGVKHLKEGYRMELMFRKKDGSFSAFQVRPSSVWLTSFVMKIFCQANSYIKDVLDPNVLKSGVQWLLDKQNPNGYWEESYPAIHRRILSGVDGMLALTPHVLISLRECAKPLDDIVDKESYNRAVNKAEAYVLSHQAKIMQLNNALLTALAAYSLTFNQNPLLSTNLTESLKDIASIDEPHNRMYWKDPYPIETAAYALMAIIKSGLRNSLDAQSVVNYLNSERSFSGSFDSSQDTMVALEALSMFSNLQYSALEKRVDLVCNITSHTHRFKRSLKFEENNALVMQQFKAESINDMLEFITQGSGIGQVYVKLRYNILEPHTQFCRFDIKIDVKEVFETIAVNHHTIPDFLKSFPTQLIDELAVQNSDSKVRRRRALNRSQILQRIRKFWPARHRTTPPPLRSANVKPLNGSGLTVITTFGQATVVTRDRNALNNTSSDENVKIISESGTKSENSPKSKLVLLLDICVNHLGRSDAEMSIVDVGLISGYVPDKRSLEDLFRVKDTLISKYEITSRSVVLYLESIPSSKPFCFSFKIVREVLVADVQAAVVKVYDYYKKGYECSQFYSPTRITEYLQTVCESHVCQCARRENCPSIKKLTELGEIASMKMLHAREKLKMLICSDKYTHVWTGNVRTVRNVSGHRILNFRIAEVIKGDRAFGTSEMLTISDECFRSQLQLHNEGRLIVFANQSSTGSIFLDNSAIVFGYEKSWHDKSLDNVNRLVNWLKTMVIRNLWGCEK